MCLRRGPLVTATTAIVIAIATASLCACRRARETTVQNVSLGDDFTLAPGDCAALQLEGVPRSSVCLVRIVSDGRCGRYYECAASLVVTVEVVISSEGKETTSQLSVWSRDRGADASGDRSCVPFGAAAVRLREVEPYPKTREQVAQELYRATFAMQPACGATALPVGATPQAR